MNETYHEFELDGVRCRRDQDKQACNGLSSKSLRHMPSLGNNLIIHMLRVLDKYSQLSALQVCCQYGSGCSAAHGPWPSSFIEVSFQKPTWDPLCVCIWYSMTSKQGWICIRWPTVWASSLCSLCLCVPRINVDAKLIAQHWQPLPDSCFWKLKASS